MSTGGGENSNSSKGCGTELSDLDDCVMLLVPSGFGISSNPGLDGLSTWNDLCIGLDGDTDNFGKDSEVVSSYCSIG